MQILILPCNEFLKRIEVILGMPLIFNKHWNTIRKQVMKIKKCLHENFSCAILIHRETVTVAYT